jgi:hypothetical protein
MKVTLIKQFKNLPKGTELNVSSRIYDHLLELGCVPDPRPIEFTPDVLKAAAEIDPKKSSKKEPKGKK